MSSPNIRNETQNSLFSLRPSLSPGLFSAVDFTRSEIILPTTRLPYNNFQSSAFSVSSSPESFRGGRLNDRQLRAAHVGAGASIDLDGFAFLDEERDVDGLAALELGRFGNVARGIAAQAFG
jgi:hypothetical protein